MELSWGLRALFSNRYRRDKEAFIPPVFSWTRKYGQAAIGGFVYRANPKSSFYGAYIFGDYQKKAIFALTQKDRVLNQVRLIAHAPQPVRVIRAGCARGTFTLWDMKGVFTSSIWIRPVLSEPATCSRGRNYIFERAGKMKHSRRQLLRHAALAACPLGFSGLSGCGDAGSPARTMGDRTVEITAKTSGLQVLLFDVFARSSSGRSA